MLSMHFLLEFFYRLLCSTIERQPKFFSSFRTKLDFFFNITSFKLVSANPPPPPPKKQNKTNTYLIIESIIYSYISILAPCGIVWAFHTEI